MKIGELSQMTNMPSSTIRYYEKVGLIVPKRSSNGYRNYPVEAVNLLNVVSQAKSLGFSLKEIRSLAKVVATKNPNGRLRNSLEQKLESLYKQIENIKSFQTNIRAMLNSDCPL